MSTPRTVVSIGAGLAGATAADVPLGDLLPAAARHA
jgi:hypothetical protein